GYQLAQRDPLRLVDEAGERAGDEDVAQLLPLGCCGGGLASLAHGGTAYRAASAPTGSGRLSRAQTLWPSPSLSTPQVSASADTIVRPRPSTESGPTSRRCRSSPAP